MKPASFRWKTIIEEYFVFSKWQRRAALFLSGCLVFIVFAPAIFLYFFKSKLEKPDAVLITQAAGLKVKSEPGGSFDKKEERSNYGFQNKSISANPAVGELFVFDPNTASSGDWQRLGIGEKTIRTIQNYLGKGGHFKKPEDLKKIYGLHADEVERLTPFIRINNRSEKGEKFPGKQAISPYNPRSYASNKSTAGTDLIDINTADTTAFISLPGIGSKLASRIINYRGKLHGFYSVEQVGETYGLPDSIFQRIKTRLRVSASAIQKMNINTATAEELKTPYIKFNVANAIVQYRLHNGRFGAVEDLKKIPLIDEALYLKIAPYLKAE